MQNHLFIPLATFSASYDCDAYGASAYNTDDCTTSTGVASGNGSLSYTGAAFYVPVAISVVIIVISIIVFLRKKQDK